MSCGPVVTARLISWRLLNLSLQKLMLLLNAIVLSNVILIGEDFRAVLRRDNLLLLFR